MSEDFAASADSARHPSLAASRRFSREALALLEAALDRHLHPFREFVHTVYAGGSLGRLEAAAGSDIDWIVVLRQDPGAARASLDAAIGAALNDAAALGLRAPKADGIYTVPVASADLLDANGRGSLTESPAIFGARMQILLDARAVYAPRAFVALRDRTLEWYRPAQGRFATWTHLINDVQRYLHAYAVWQQFRFKRSAEDGWYLRQAKLRATRIPTFAGLLLLLAESERETDPLAWVGAQLKRTSLERLAYVFARHDEAFDEVHDDYAALHLALTDATVRRELIDTSPDSAQALPLEFPAPYALLHDRSARMMARICRFIVEHSGSWPPHVLRNWLL